MGTHDRKSDSPSAWAARDCGSVGLAEATASRRTFRLQRSVQFQRNMARMHSRRRGSSGSDKPAADDPPEWSDVDSDAIEERVVELAEAGHSPSEIGLKLRDEGVQGTPVPDVKLATDKKVTEILDEHDAEPEIPEDLRNLMAKAVRLRDHVQENQTDHQNKRALQNTESKIRRLINYYRGDELDEEFSYSVDEARDLI